jgi:hypothetical protein
MTLLDGALLDSALLDGAVLGGALLDETALEIELVKEGLPLAPQVSQSTHEPTTAEGIEKDDKEVYLINK